MPLSRLSRCVAPSLYKLFPLLATFVFVGTAHVAFVSLILGFQTLIIPAIISLILFIISTYVFYPLWQRYRSRYNNYLPLDSISSQTSSIRARVQDAIARLIVPSLWSRSLTDRLVVAENGSEGGFDSDDGEELGDVHESTRGASHHRGNSLDSTGRLSRESV